MAKKPTKETKTKQAAKPKAKKPPISKGKLTQAEARKLHESGMTDEEMAKKYGHKPREIWRLRTRGILKK